jgi:hypothetical protein
MNPASSMLALAAAASAAAVLAEPCAGQGEPTHQDTPEKLPNPGSDLTISLNTGYQHIFDMDLETTGDVSINRAGVHLQGRGSVARDVRLEVNFRFLYDNYDFGDAFALDPIDGAPWENLSTLALDATLEWWVVNDVAVLFGLTMDSSGETGADWDQTFTGGVRFGALFVTNKALVWGLGLGITSQLDDSFLVYPIFILNWHMSAQARLQSVAGPVGIASTGLEFVYDLGGGLETGVGLRYEYRRFRLDDEGFAPGGVGQDDSFPFWARISYRFTPNLSADLYAGFVFAAKFKVDDFNGLALTSEDGDPGATLALAVRFKF